MLNIAASIQAIFDEFKDKIIDLTYYPPTPIETLKARITAVSCLVSDDKVLAEKAADFIKLTSTMKEEDLQRLREFATGITEWREFEICSVYTNGFGPVVEYKICVATEQSEKLIHRHALYKIENEQCCYVSQTSPLIRVIGDPVLHQPGNPFPENYSVEERSCLNFIDKLKQQKLSWLKQAALALPEINVQRFNLLINSLL